MIFLAGLQRQKIVLPSAKPARRVLSAISLLQASLSNGQPKQFQREKASMAELCQSLHTQTCSISTLMCHPVWKVNLKLFATEHADLGLQCRLHCPVQEIHLLIKADASPQGHTECWKRMSCTFLPVREYPCRASIPFLFASVFSLS